jgi:hypothetical protein
MMRQPDEVKDILRQAADIVAAAQIPDDLRAVALGKAVDLLAGESRGAAPKRESGSAEGTDDLLERIATKLGLEVELVEETFEVQDDQVQLTIPRAKLDSTKTGGAKQIAVLVAAARQAAGVEDKTSVDVIRLVADEYGKYDSANFSTSLHEQGDYYNITGPTRARELKVKRAGFDEAAALLKRLHG